MRVLRHLTLGAFLAAASLANGATPPWVRAAIPAQMPDVKDAPAVVLLDETVVKVAPDGTLSSRSRRVVKILTAAGRDYGSAVVWFDHDTKLRSLRGWSIDAAGSEYAVRERDAIETTPADFELYTDAKMKVLPIPAANPGTLVAFEVELADKPYLPQTEWRFQEVIPVLQARYELALPPGWTYEAHWMNHAVVQPSGSGWTLQSIPAVADEERRPDAPSVAGRVGLHLLAPGAKPLTWADIGRWFGALATPRTVATEAVQAKVRELAAGAAPLQAMARFAQRDVRYVAIEVGIGGYQPHAAGDVFANRFGDCKDKVTLLRTMLRESGLEAQAVLVNTSRGAVDPSFPSLGAFNHVIAAIPVSAAEALGLDAVIEHPRFGRLLLFDPTSTLTPFGQLPSWLQGGRGLLVTADGGEMIELPAHDPRASQLRRTAALQLDAQGTLTGTVEEVRTGHMASSLRMEMQPLTTPERVKVIERGLAGHLASYTASDVVIEHLDDPEKDLIVRYRLRAPLYAKLVADMVLVRPRVIGQKSGALVDATKRELDYVTEGPSLQIDEVDIKLPAAFRLDELPPSVSIDSDIVRYASASTLEAGVLRYRRQYELKKFTVPRVALPELNRAWMQILADERASAVFK